MLCSRQRCLLVAESAGVLPGPLRTGEHFVSGNWACAEGAVSAGCGYYAAYPITPATEIAEIDTRVIYTLN